MPAFRDLTGMTFGRTKVLRLHSMKNGRSWWLCRCFCDKEWVTTGNSLVCGKTTTCGCERYINMGNATRTHGMKHTSIYNVWQGMRRRCLNPREAGFKNYGGRGIEICKRWDKFENFYADMGDRPGVGKEATIERRDNNGNYEPDNCFWKDWDTQCNNKRTNRKITAQGITKNVCQWAAIKGIRSGTIRARLDKCGWSVEQALGFLAPPFDPHPHKFYPSRVYKSFIQPA